MSFVRPLALFLVFLALPAASLAAVRFEAEIDRTRVMVGERVQVEVILQGEDIGTSADISPPGFPSALKLVGVSGPFTQQNMRWENGKFFKSGTVKLVYNFEVRSTGTVTIPSFVYRHQGEVMRTAPLNLQVEEPPPPSVVHGDTAWRPPQDPYLELRVNKEEAYVGEQIMATWHLYFRQPFYDAKVINRPAGSSFMSEELGMVKQLNPVSEFFGGQEWKTSYIYGMALYPIQEGKPAIEPLEMSVFLGGGGRDFFGRPLGRHVEFASDPVAIRVKPLPETGRPPGFTGAVGNFRISIDNTRGELKTNEQFKFTLTVTGDGHPDYVPKPEIDLPDGIELYTESVDKDLVRDKGRVVGVKTFKMVLVPKEPGNYSLPAFEFPYFDPERETYRMAKSSGIRLSVTKGKEPEDLPPMGGFEPSLITPTGEDLRYIKPDRQKLADHGEGLLARPFVLALQVLPVLAVGGAFLFRRRKERLSADRAFARKIRASRRYNKAMKAAERAMKDGDVLAAHSAAYRALCGFVGDTWNRPDEGMTGKDVEETLDAAGVSDDLKMRSREILDECDRARFAPGALGQADARALLDRVRSLVRELAGEAKK